MLIHTGMINGLPGFITRTEADGELQTTALEIEDGKVTAIHVMRNPDKLKHMHQAATRSAPAATNRMADTKQAAVRTGFQSVHSPR